MPPVTILFILSATGMITACIHVAYIVSHKAKRENILAERKAKHGQLSYDVYNRLYTRHFLTALILIALSQTLFVGSDIIEIIQDADSALSMIIGAAGMISGISGGYLAMTALQGKRKAVDEEEW